MNILKAELTAKALMQQHGIGDWVFVWGEAKNYFGMCYWDKKTIMLSRPLTELNDEKFVLNTILHEIAHALAPRTEHHGKVWREIAVRLGCEPKRCYSPEVLRPRAIYTTTCTFCGRTNQKNRKPKSGSACGVCCDKYNHGRYAKKYKLTYKRNV